MAKQSKLDTLEEEDYLELESNFNQEVQHLKRRNCSYVCYMVQKRNAEAQRKVREYLVDYMNKFYSRQKAQDKILDELFYFKDGSYWIKEDYIEIDEEDFKDLMRNRKEKPKDD